MKVACIVCGKEMELPVSLTRVRKTCSIKCGGIYRSRRMTKFPVRRCVCESCGRSFEVSGRKHRGRYCSQVCFHKHWTGRSRRNIVCPVCSKIFTIDAHDRGQIYCSHLCQYKAQSLGIIKSYSRGRYGYRPDLGKTFRSSLEANFARVCVHEGWDWQYEPKCFETSLGVYTPDFWIREWDAFVELRGFKGRSLKKPLLAARKCGFKLIVIYQKEFELRWGGLSKKIREWENGKQFFGEIDPNVYDKRMCPCGKEFLHRKSAATIGKFCSKACTAKYKDYSTMKGVHKGTRKIVVWECEECGRSFKKREMRVGKHRFCSRKCYWKSLRRRS